MDGIRTVDVDTDLHTVDVVFDNSLTDTDEMAKALNARGYPVEDIIWPDSPPAEEHISKTVSEAWELINSDEELIVVDVREENEFCGSGGHLPDAENYPWDSGILQADYAELPPEIPVLLVSESGFRSNAAASFLWEKGYTVYDMEEGMNAWEWETEICDTTVPEYPDTPSEPDSGENTGGDGGGGCFISAGAFSFFRW